MAAELKLTMRERAQLAALNSLVKSGTEIHGDVVLSGSIELDLPVLTKLIERGLVCPLLTDTAREALRTRVECPNEPTDRKAQLARL